MGNTTTGNSFIVTTNIPHWTVALITDGPDVGTAPPSEFDDFSFAPFTAGSGTRVHVVSGKGTQTVKVYVARKEFTSSRTFKILVSGIGYDGKILEHIIPVAQYGYSWGTDIVPLSADVLQPNGRIPQVGDTYALTVNITPNDIELPAGAEIWGYITANGNTYPSTPRQAIIPGIYTYTIQLPVSPNTLPDVRAVGLTVLTNLPHNAGARQILIYQDNK